MAMIDQLLDQAEPADLGFRIEPLTVRRTARVADAVAALPDPQRFHRQAGEPRGDAAAIAHGGSGVLRFNLQDNHN